MLFNEDVTFNAPIRINAGISRNPQKFTRGDTTPSVKSHNFWVCNNVVGVTVTKFDNGQECQDLSILGDGFTTIANNANIKTNTAANKLLAVNKIYRFTYINSVWYEDA